VNAPSSKTRANLSETVTMIMAGGQGERLWPLTRDRAKPAVPFGGNYRLIDFTLSNCLNSNVRRVHVLTQYKSDSLNRHIRLGWNVLNPELGEYIEVNPPQMRLTSHWYLGTADAVYQNVYTLEHERPQYVLLLSGDHVYKMDYGPMIEQHVDTDADLTVACIEVPVEEAARLGVVSVDAGLRAVSFTEKPAAPPSSGAQPDGARILCSMGVYVFKTKTLVRRVVEDAKRSTTHDFGRDVVPAMIQAGDRVFGYRFPGVIRPDDARQPYWRDVGTLDVYWQTHMDLLGQDAKFDLHDPDWPVRTYVQNAPPADMICEPGHGACACVCDSLLCNGAVVHAASVRHSVIGRHVHIGPGSSVEDSVILAGVRIGRNVTVRKSIIDKGNQIPDGARIGVDPEEDARHFTISEGGVVVVPKEMPLFRPA
jgi:glucose-1-phosphate adenylyltransferase